MATTQPSSAAASKPCFVRVQYTLPDHVEESVEFAPTEAAHIGLPEGQAPVKVRTVL